MCRYPHFRESAFRGSTVVPLLLQVLVYAEYYAAHACFNVEVILCTYSKILMVIGICILRLWDIQLTFDLYNMGHFESYTVNNDSHGMGSEIYWYL